MKKDFKKLSDAAFMGSFSLQGANLLWQPMNIHTATDSAVGFMGLGIAGAAHEAAWKMTTRKPKRKKKKGG